MINTSVKFIHLLYAPTNFCNMGCKYCYLGSGSDEKTNTQKSLETLKFTIESCLRQGVMPYNISFHGGEATAIPKSVLYDLLMYVKQYYYDNANNIKNAGFPLTPLHIKTNLYNFDQCYELFEKFEVSISGSVDLPLFLHEKYRTDKKGNSTLNKITENLHLLANYPHHKKISCVITKEHMNYLDSFIKDIRHINDDIGLDMTKFNIMFSFDSTKNLEKFHGKINGTEMLSGEEQVVFYHRLNQAFKGTNLEEGLTNHWFKEFTPDFCCSAINCGDKFFLLQSNGDVYACPRGQSSQKFYYGNVFRSSIQMILDNGWKTIEILENQKEPNEECYTCKYLPCCNQGCIFVREETALTKSYTCELQKEIYQDNPEKYPPFESKYIKDYSLTYRFRNNLNALKVIEMSPSVTRYVTPELYEDKNALATLIQDDPILTRLYTSTMFKIIIDDVEYTLSSPILNNVQEIALISANSDIHLLVSDDAFSINTTDLINNTLYIMLLRNTLISYGDENRTKQEHIVDYSIYQPTFHAMSIPHEEFRRFDLKPFFVQHQNVFIDNIRNNLFFTTKTIREYHYQKKKKNAFYHIQAINLPFPYLEFYWLKQS